MKIEYDPTLDLLYIWFGTPGQQAAQTATVVPGVHADFDVKGKLIGIEVLDASEVLDRKVQFEVGLPDGIIERQGADLAKEVAEAREAYQHGDVWPGGTTGADSSRTTGLAQVVLEVPHEVLQAMQLPPGEIEKELRKELALALYQRGVLSLDKARILAQMTYLAFDELVRQRDISQHSGEANTDEARRYAVGDQ